MHQPLMAIPQHRALPPVNITFFVNITALCLICNLEPAYAGRLDQGHKAHDNIPPLDHAGAQTPLAR